MKCARKHSAPRATDRNTVDALLARAGLRRTKERVSVLRTLARLHAPCTVEALLVATDEQVNKVTLYRMLEQFADAGLVERVAHPDGIRRYEFQEEHHHHITCTRCGVRSRVSVPERALLAHALKGAPSFSRVTSHALELYGVCKQCVS
jgi:Fur family ferric uptake transcriptional regulator